jgi:hypothetical protein
MTQVVYDDDPDSYVEWSVTDAQGQNLDWADPKIAIGGAAYSNAEWRGVAAPTRTIRIYPSGLGLAPGVHQTYLRIPNGTDIRLGAFVIVTRT